MVASARAPCAVPRLVRFPGLSDLPDTLTGYFLPDMTKRKYERSGAGQYVEVDRRVTVAEREARFEKRARREASDTRTPAQRWLTFLGDAAVAWPLGASSGV